MVALLTIRLYAVTKTVDMRSEDITKVTTDRCSISNLHASSPSGRVMHTLRPWISGYHCATGCLGLRPRLRVGGAVPFSSLPIDYGPGPVALLCIDAADTCLLKID